MVRRPQRGLDKISSCETNPTGDPPAMLVRQHLFDIYWSMSFACVLGNIECRISNDEPQKFGPDFEIHHSTFCGSAFDILHSAFRSSYLLD
jgi:hypothetical protein